MIVALHRSQLDEEVIALARWFGSYLLWSEVDSADRESWRQRVIVRHLRGRNMPAPALLSEHYVDDYDD